MDSSDICFVYITDNRDSNVSVVYTNDDNTSNDINNVYTNDNKDSGNISIAFTHDDMVRSVLLKRITTRTVVI